MINSEILAGILIFGDSIKMNTIRKLFQSNFQNTLLTNNLHTTGSHLAWAKSTLPKTFINNNKKIYPPQEIGEDPRPAVSKILIYCEILSTFFLI